VGVYFVYRCHYQGPTEKHLRRFEDESVLDWFRDHWQGIAGTEAAHEHAEQLLGCHVFMFWRLFVNIAEENWPPPENAAQLEGDLRHSLYVSGEMNCAEHVVQVRNDDDELETAIYIFDDHFLKKHGKLAAFLLHEDWKLLGGQREGRFRPTETYTDLEPAPSGPGATYLALLAFYDPGNLDDMQGGYRLKGVRLPDLARFLTALERDDVSDWPHEMQELFLGTHLSLSCVPSGQKATTQEDAFLFAICDDPAEESNWNVYADWLEERGLSPPGLRLLERALTYAVEPCTSRVGRKRSRDLTHVEEHLAQACLHVGGNEFHQWILFDDLWASAHPEMANAILRFARRWDVLTTD
jgi:uncharacterized protein (TIGR02996 family)